MEQIRKIMRPTDVPDQGLLCDLLWADPDNEILGWGENERTEVSFTFGTEIVSKFLTKHDLDLIVRGNQVGDIMMVRESTSISCSLVCPLPISHVMTC